MASASQHPGSVACVLHVLTVGDELPDDVPTVVFLHGLFGQGRNFSTIAKGLLPDARSVLVDLPNHGRSAWTETVDLAVMADAVAERVRAGADGPVHLVGHSLGGKVAMLVALRHPELLDRLVVVDIAPTASRSVGEDRKSTRLNSSHVKISYAVFCLKKKKKKKHKRDTADDETQH